MQITFDRTISDISNFIESQGFYYTDEQIYDFYISLKTKPFVIISGISGSGKSKIADLFAEYMAKSYGNIDNYELVSVKPNWTDNRGIFGYQNLLTGTYEITPTLKLFIRALANPDKPYFLVLDEMNLAKVEHYFSDFLSLLESGRLSTGTCTERNFETVKQNLGGEAITLSEAIILSALQMPSREFKSVEQYRTTEIAKWWVSTSASKHYQAQFRSELNQGRPTGEVDSTTGFKRDGTRLASKAFWAETSGNSYKLKELSEMDSDTRFKVERLMKAFIVEKTTIKQEKIHLHNSDKPLICIEGQAEYDDTIFNGIDYYVPGNIEIPTNIFVIGTVNVDETTYMFSPKVLDRSNVIEFNEVDLFNAFGYGMAPKQSKAIPSNGKNVMDLTISIATSDTTKSIITTYPEIFEVLNKIYELLKQKNKHFGYRVFNEISLFIVNYVGESGNQEEVIDALDLQVLQKILPKINGTEDEILSLMNKLSSVAKEENLVRSRDKIECMIAQLISTGYATYIE
ncbi:hypothetical protein [Lactococcus petauri]|uniref:hypothetical protein n=1 Tax=Lactococcus petauri TaxID=1940789 RepID=UPI00385506CE